MLHEKVKELPTMTPEQEATAQRINFLKERMLRIEIQFELLSKMHEDARKELAEISKPVEVPKKKEVGAA